jgi:hypothetical protein
VFRPYGIYQNGCREIFFALYRKNNNMQSENKEKDKKKKIDEQGVLNHRK